MKRLPLQIATMALPLALLAGVRLGDIRLSEDVALPSDVTAEAAQREAGDAANAAGLAAEAAARIAGLEAAMQHAEAVVADTLAQTLPALSVTDLRTLGEVEGEVYSTWVDQVVWEPLWLVCLDDGWNYLGETTWEPTVEGNTVRWSGGVPEGTAYLDHSQLFGHVDLSGSDVFWVDAHVTPGDCVDAATVCFYDSDWNWLGDIGYVPEYAQVVFDPPKRVFVDIVVEFSPAIGEEVSLTLQTGGWSRRGLVPGMLSVPTAAGVTKQVGQAVADVTATLDATAAGLQAGIAAVPVLTNRVDIYTPQGGNPGPWNWYKPAKAILVEVEALGGGGSGGAGGRGSNASGGTGGTGGWYRRAVFLPSQLTAAVSVYAADTITGGFGRNTNGDGQNGVAGGSSTFGTYLTALGGAGGTGGKVGADAAAPAGSRTLYHLSGAGCAVGASGADAVLSGVSGPGSRSMFAGAGGGAGGSTGGGGQNAGSAGGGSVTSNTSGDGGGGAGGSAGGTAGSHGSIVSGSTMGTGGGGGGGANGAGVAGGKGGNGGGQYGEGIGAGGGGGGASVSGYSGQGGTGSRGTVRVTTWYYK